MSDVCSSFTKELMRRVTEQEAALLLHHAPNGAVVNEITMQQERISSIRLYSYKDVPFLKLHPVQFCHVENDDGSMSVVANVKYEILNDDD